MIMHRLVASIVRYPRANIEYLYRVVFSYCQLQNITNHCVCQYNFSVMLQVSCIFVVMHKLIASFLL